MIIADKLIFPVTYDDVSLSTEIIQFIDLLYKHMRS